jgi:hypothetical protein
MIAMLSSRSPIAETFADCALLRATLKLCILARPSYTTSRLVPSDGLSGDRRSVFGGELIGGIDGD